MAERITLRVSLAREDEAWLRQRADDLDLDVTGVLRMIVRQARKGVAQVANPDDLRHTSDLMYQAQMDLNRKIATDVARAAEEAERKRRAEIEAKKEALRRQLAELEGEGSSSRLPQAAWRMLNAGETVELQRNELLDNLPMREADDFEVPPDPDGGVASDEIGSLLAQADNLMHAAAAPRRGPPGTLTEPVGVNRSLGSGYQHGDAKGNLVRQNFGHLGFSGGVRG